MRPAPVQGLPQLSEEAANGQRRASETARESSRFAENRDRTESMSNITCTACSDSFPEQAGYKRCPSCNALPGADAEAKQPSLAGTLQGVFSRFQGYSIGLNYSHPSIFSRCTLVKANQDYFSVRPNAVLMPFPDLQVASAGHQHS